MTDEPSLSLVARRNTVAFEAALRDVYAQLAKAQEVIRLQQTALGSLTARMNALEQQLVIQKVQLTGLGPSVRD